MKIFYYILHTIISCSQKDLYRYSRNKLICIKCDRIHNSYSNYND